NAMVRPFTVHQPQQLDGLVPGMLVEFTLVVNQPYSYAERIHVHSYESLEHDPLTARRLKLLDKIVDPSSSKEKVLEIGQHVPDFTLTDQNRQPVTFSQFAGKVAAVTFIY